MSNTALALASRASRAQTSDICCCSSGNITSGPLIALLTSPECSRISFAKRGFKHCTPAASSVKRRHRLYVGRPRTILKAGTPDDLHLAAAVDGPGERRLVGVLELAPHGDAGGDAGGSDPQRPEQLGEIDGGRLALDA